MTYIARVLYEDQRGPAKEFGLHALVLACVADRTEIDRWQLKSLVDGVPMKGNSKLLAACRSDLWAPSGEPLFALFDEDRVRDLVGASASACRAVVTGMVARGRLGSGPLTVALLRQNLETVLRAIGMCGLANAREVTLAIETKDLNDRDRLLHRAAGGLAADRSGILEQVESLNWFVQRVADAVTALRTP